MLVVAGQVAINPAKWDEAVELVLAAQTETRKEEGVIQYTFSAELEPTHIIHVFEIWEDEEALDAHLQTPHIQTFFAALPSVVLAPPEVQRYYISNVKSL